MEFRRIRLNDVSSNHSDKSFGIVAVPCLVSARFDGLSGSVVSIIYRALKLIPIVLIDFVILRFFGSHAHNPSYPLIGQLLVFFRRFYPPLRSV
jgi:hypothetical protein